MPSNQRKPLSAGFYRLSRSEREACLIDMGVVHSQDLELLHREGALDFGLADQCIENAIGCFPLPLGLAFNLVVNGQAYVVPMAVEETSVVAALSFAAKWVREQGEITAANIGVLGIGQVQIPKVSDPAYVKHMLDQHKGALIDRLNREAAPSLWSRGGGVKEITWRELARPDGATMGVVHVWVDTCDAMGANLINQICEFSKPLLEELLGEQVGLCILSNLADGKIVQAQALIRSIDRELGEAIAEASLFAQLDPYRAATNNKGVMNGLDAVLIATGNDWRAVEAGVHAYAARSGHYRPVTVWSLQGDSLRGTIEIPLSVGIVGGMTRLHPLAQMSLKILGVSSAAELAGVLAAVGLVQNLAALKALSTHGINKGHMKLHVANLALAAGASADELPLLKHRLMQHWEKHKRVTESDAKAILGGLRKNEPVINNP